LGRRSVFARHFKAPEINEFSYTASEKVYITASQPTLFLIVEEDQISVTTS
jgi:hypothetical protein